MSVRLVPLGPAHYAELMRGQDERYRRHISGAHWEGPALAAFLARAQRWRADGPLQELAALDSRGHLVGGGGVHRLGAGLERGQADVTYWVLAEHRGRGLGGLIAGAVAGHAFADARIREVVLRIAPGNARSRAVALRLGARPTGIWERHPVAGEGLVERWVLTRPRGTGQA